MLIKHYKLLAGEKIVLQDAGVSHAGAGFSDELILTNQRIIWVSYGLLGIHKETRYYLLSQVQQAVSGKAKNGKQQLEIHMTDGVETFGFKAKKRFTDWVAAIEKQLEACNKQQSKDDKKKQLAKNIGIVKTVLKPLAENEKVVQTVNEFVGDVAYSVIQQGELSASGLKQGIVDASKKQIQKSPVARKIKDGLGLNAVADEVVVDADVTDAVEETVADEAADAAGDM